MWLISRRLGIKGNSHMLMMDKNNAETADMIQKWLVDKGSERVRAGVRYAGTLRALHIVAAQCASAIGAYQLSLAYDGSGDYGRALSGPAIL